jgi:single-stranded-DNA-specific exonuclease
MPGQDDMGKRWRIYPHDAVRIADLERSAGVSPIVAQLLIARGVAGPSAARQFLDARLSDLRDPETLPGVPAAADRLIAAVRDGRRIVIYGDYDADGMTATAVLYHALRLLEADVGYYVPNRLEEGYGLNEAALRTLATRGTKVIVSVDCGIASLDEARMARELGIELIVTDHHEFGAQLPDAAAIVHPRLPGHDYPFGELCGAGVAFKLAWAVCCRASESKKVSPRMREFLLGAIGLAAIGTVADVVRLLDENRVLVRHGLTSLRERPTPGVQALLRVTQLDEKPGLAAEDIAFTLAPRLNAAGRLGQAQLGVELLTTDSAERAASLADYIHQLNSSRESLERSVYLAATKQLKEQFDDSDPAFVLAGSGWHPGVIGIVAGRMAERYCRPVVLISLDEFGSKPGSGSGRSAGGINLHEALRSCSLHLVAHGGHAAAAGLKIAPHAIDAFRAEFCEFVAAAMNESDRVAEVLIDAEAPFSQLTLPTVQQIETMAPFGHGNPRAVLCATAVRMAEPPRRLGGGDRHLALRLVQHRATLRAVAFGQGDWFEELEKVQEPIDVVYRPVINEFQGRRSVEIHLVDWRPNHRTAEGDPS